MPDLTLFEEANDAATRRATWPERKRLIALAYPRAHDPMATLPVVLKDDAVLVRVLQDILKYDSSETGRSGKRPNLDLERGMQSWRELTGQDFTGLRFDRAFRLIAYDGVTGKPESLTRIARKTGISRSRVHRLIIGAEAPDPEVIEAVAPAYGKKPQFFAEYRAWIVALRVSDVLAENPEFSANIFRQVAGGGGR